MFQQWLIHQLIFFWLALIINCYSLFLPFALGNVCRNTGDLNQMWYNLIEIQLFTLLTSFSSKYYVQYLPIILHMNSCLTLILGLINIEPNTYGHMYHEMKLLLVKK